MLRGPNTLLQTGRLTRKNPLADRGRAIHKRQARLRVHVLTQLIPPRSALELPVSHHLKIHSADQLGRASAAFMSVVVCFKVLVFEPKTTVPPITAAIAPIRTVGSNPSAPMTVAKIKIPPAAMAAF